LKAELLIALFFLLAFGTPVLLASAVFLPLAKQYRKTVWILWLLSTAFGISIAYTLGWSPEKWSPFGITGGETRISMRTYYVWVFVTPQLTALVLWLLVKRKNAILSTIQKSTVAVFVLFPFIFHLGTVLFRK
jgi:hypothetical protein